MSMRTGFVCLLAISFQAFAQSDRGTITGTIADPAGAVVAAAPVELRNVGTGGLYQVASSATGNYTLGQLPAGIYQMTVSVPGFKTFLRQNIQVQATQTTRVDIELEVGSAAESITVTDEVSLLQTESGELSHTIAAKRLNDLPILGIGGGNSSTQGLRFYLAQTQLIPGTYQIAGSGTLRVNGAPNSTQRTLIEGMDATNSLITFVPASTAPSVDAVQETSIQTSNYSAEFGQVGGGVVNVTMKSGTNTMHGSLYNYMANDAFNAATPFVNQKPDLNRNDYGFSFGAPVLIPKLYDGHDKTFFFWNFEQYREFFQTNNRPVTLPRLDYRAGDFSGIFPNHPRTLTTDPLKRPVIEGTIYDPLTNQIVGGQVVRDAFPGNMLPASRLDPVALKIQSLIPEPDTGGQINNWTPSFPNDRVTSNYSLKLDHQIGARAKLSGYFGTNKTAAQYSQDLNGTVGLPLPIDNTRGTFTQSWTWRVNFDYTLSPNLLLHMGAGYVVYRFNDNSPLLEYDALNELGLAGTTVRGKGGRFPNITGLSAAAGGMVTMGPGPQSSSAMFTPSGILNLTWVKGNHTYKFGGEVRPQGYLTHSLTGTNGNLNFSSEPTALPYLQTTTVSGGTIGFPYASFLLGQVTNGRINPPSDGRTGKMQWNFYIQDTWKVTRKLTLDYGLRWDYSAAPTEQYGRMPNFSPSVVNETAGGHPGGVIFGATCHCSFFQNYKKAFGPRVGAAYQIDDKTVFRAGFGITYNVTGTGGHTFGLAANTFQTTFGETSVVLKDGIPAEFAGTWPDFDPSRYPVPGNPAALTAPPVVIDQNAGRPARQMMWSIGLQREIFRDLVVEASYVANRGVWWQNGSSQLDYNAINDDILKAYGLDRNNPADLGMLLARVNTAAAGRFRNQIPYSGFPTSRTVSQSLRPYPQFAPGGFPPTFAPTWNPTGNTWYDSLQAKVTKRFSHGLDFTYAFTWAKELERGPVTNDVFNRATAKTLSSLSRPLVSVLAANYTLPALPTNRAVSWALRDWMLGAVLQYASGTPIAAPSSLNRLNSALSRSATTRRSRVPGEPLYLVDDINCGCLDPRRQLILNPDAWVDAPAGQFGTASYYYNDYRTFRYPSESMSLARLFRIKERATIMVRMEFSNVFNRTMLNSPSSTNPTTAVRTDANGNYTAGFGWINVSSVARAPRQGTFVLRLQF